MPLPAALVLALTTEPAPVERGIAPAVGMTAFSTGVWLGLVAGQREHAPRACRVCASNAADEATRAALRWKKPKVADALSNVGLVVTPVWAMGTLAIAGAADRRANAVDPLLVVESTTIAMMVNQIVKLEVGRRRPDAHHGLAPPGGVEDNLSFFSGHATWSFTSAVAAGTVASLRGYRGAPAVWAGGLAFAATTAYLRIAADRHWLSDVLVGAAAGALAGALIPRLHLAAPEAMASALGPGAAPAWMTVGGVF